MTTLARVATLAALVGGVLAGIAPTASAETVKVKTLETLTVRANADDNSRAVGTIPKGTTFKTSDLIHGGGSYKACGYKDSNWTAVSWNGAKGWVVRSCVMPL